MAVAVEIYNIEQGMPTVETARKKMLDKIDSSRKKGIKVIKLIHGYGSSGKGGVLRIELRRIISARVGTGKIAGYCPGEDWNIFDAKARTILDAVPELRKDSDLGKFNSGITFILI